MLGGRPTGPAPANPTAYAKPSKEEGEQRKNDCTDVRVLIAGPSVKEAARNHEEANRIENEESAEGKQPNC